MKTLLVVVLLAAAVLLFAAPPGFARDSRPYRSLAVMDLELEGATPEEMAEIVDCLTRRISESGSMRRVVDRQKREKLLGRQPQVQRSRDYDEEQMSRAERLPVELAVLGRLSWNRQQYELEVRLLAVESREVLYRQRGSFPDRGELLAACDRLAAGIAAAAAAGRALKPETKRELPPLEPSVGIGLGQEGVSAGSGVSGGSYLYLDALAMLNRFVGIDAGYALRLFPSFGGSHLLRTHLRVHVPLAKDAYTALGLGYLLSMDAGGASSHLVGGRVAPIAGGDDEVFFELLPVALYFDVETGEAVFTLELLAVTVFFGR